MACNDGIVCCDDELRDKIMFTENHGGSVKAVIRELGESKGAKKKIAKDARKQIEMKGKQIKDAMSLARYDTTVYEAT